MKLASFRWHCVSHSSKSEEIASHIDSSVVGQLLFFLGRCRLFDLRAIHRMFGSRLAIGQNSVFLIDSLAQFARQGQTKHALLPNLGGNVLFRSAYIRGQSRSEGRIVADGRRTKAPRELGQGGWQSYVSPRVALVNTRLCEEQGPKQSNCCGHWW